MMNRELAGYSIVTGNTYYAAFCVPHNPTDRPPSADLAAVVLYSGKGMEAEKSPKKKTTAEPFGYTAASSLEDSTSIVIHSLPLLVNSVNPNLQKNSKK